MSADITARAVDLYVNKGLSLREIAAEVHYSHVEVWRRLRAAGVQLRPPVRPVASSEERP